MLFYLVTFDVTWNNVMLNGVKILVNIGYFISLLFPALTDLGVVR